MTHEHDASVVRRRSFPVPMNGANGLVLSAPINGDNDLLLPIPINGDNDLLLPGNNQHRPPAQDRTHQPTANNRQLALATWILCSTTNRILHSPLCNLMFGCACAPLWAGGWRHCNVHRPNVALPRCPWCTMWLRKDAVGFMYKAGFFDSAPDQDGLAVLAMTATFYYSFQTWRKQLVGVALPWAVLLSSVASLLAGFVSCAMVGFVWGRAANYPYWFGLGNATAVEWDYGNVTGGGDSSGVSLFGSIVVGTVGGMLWSGMLLGGGVLCCRRCCGVVQEKGVKGGGGGGALCKNNAGV